MSTNTQHVTLKSPKMCNDDEKNQITETCTSTSTRHLTLKSPLLLQFPYCELCDTDNKQSNL